MMLHTVSTRDFMVV